MVDVADEDHYVPAWDMLLDMKQKDSDDDHTPLWLWAGTIKFVKETLRGRLKLSDPVDVRLDDLVAA